MTSLRCCRPLLSLTFLALGGLTGCPSDDPVIADTTADASADAGADSVGDVDGVTPDIGTDAPADGGNLGPIVDVVSVIPQCEAPAPLTRTFSATLRWTTYGVPHIAGDTLGDLAYGQGYAVARDHICTLADQYLKAGSERSKFFGAGANDANLTSDIGWKAVGLRDKAQCMLGDLSQEAREMMVGYAAGYNRYLADTGVGNLPAACANAEWVRPITELDVQSHLLMLVLRASADALIGTVVAASPPEIVGKADSFLPAPTNYGEAEMPDLRKVLGEMGSNGWGLGADRTDNGRGKLVANPHFPWEGALRLHEVQLTAPAATLNVHGAALVGVPGVLIGFNENLGWTHTVSASQRFTMYRLTLDPDDPTVYVYGDERRRMVSRDVDVEVKQDDGSLETVSRTYYSSHYGPIINATPLVWGKNAAFTYRDANFENSVFIDQFLAMNRATDIESFKDAFRDFNGIPWVNTMYADKDGNAFYIDSTPVPRMSPEALQWHAEAITGTVTGDSSALFAGLVYFNFGAYLFDGSRTSHEWTAVAGARSPGITPFEEAPQQTRTDYISNANDSHWLGNLDAPLEGYSPLYGAEKTARSPRTRLNLRMLTEVAADGISGADGKFDFDELKAVRTSNRAFLFEEWQAGVVARCTGQVITVDETPVDLTEACAVLAAWDGRLNVTSVGAPLMRETIAYWAEANDFDQSKIFATPFDVANPIATPSGLPAVPTSGDDPIIVALARGVVALTEAGIALDAPFSEAQFTKAGGQIIPIPGGNGLEGAFNIVTYSNDNTTLLPKIPRASVVHGQTDLTSEGYQINYGTSFVMALEFTEDGPRAECLLTYGQSADPTSPYAVDQTTLFGQDSWRPILFTEAQLVADPNLTELTITTE